jgi:hypothetical protein
MLGWGWQSVHDPKELPRVLAKWAAAVREGAPWEDSFPLRGADGEYRLFLSRAFPIRDSSGNVVRWFGTNTDISEHAKAQEVLRRTEKLAAAGRLAASIAHEINNPLEAVTNLLYLVAQDDGVPDRLKEYLRMADEELQRVAHIARQTLGFYKETTYPTHFLVSDVLDEVVRLHGRKLTSKQIAVHRQYRDPGEIVASRGELRQVFSNLVSNAWQIVLADRDHKVLQRRACAAHLDRRRRFRHRARAPHAHLRTVLHHQKRCRYGARTLGQPGDRREARRHHAGAQPRRPGHRLFGYASRCGRRPGAAQAIKRRVKKAGN